MLCCTTDTLQMPSNSIQATKIPPGGTTLLIIDAQNDFHPGDQNSLSIANANADAERIAKLIQSSIDKSKKSSTINRIVATLDTHHKLHIAHPTFWIDENNNHPTPFTSITCADIRKGTWKPRSNLKIPFGPKSHQLDLDILNNGKSKSKITMDEDGNIDLLSYVIEYTTALEASGKFTLTIWPEHCLIGSRGHNIVSNINDAFQEWSSVTGTSVEYVTKGENLLTEMYSVLKAEVPISEETKFNHELFESLNSSDKIIVCGQALSHCVNYSVVDLMENMTRKRDRKKVIMLSDCASPVLGCEKDAENFLEYVKRMGGTVCKMEDI